VKFADERQSLAERHSFIQEKAGRGCETACERMAFRHGPGMVDKGPGIPI